jgi:uncharacterized protein (DUF2252 family)
MTSVGGTVNEFGHASVTERVTSGRAARATVPRSSHAEWNPPKGRFDPVSVLQAQAQTRLPDLVPLRHARMLVSPFSFYRGAAAIMAADLATTPSSGKYVQCCGDAHLMNFGGFESPERTLVFDINDFDETLRGPWEWDVKRLATSFAVAAQDLGFDKSVARGAVECATRTYRQTMRDLAAKRNLEVWYARLDPEGVADRWRSDVSKREAQRVQRQADKAVTKDSLRAFATLTERVGGRIRIVSDPPLLVRFEEVVPPGHVDEAFARVETWLESYRRTLQPNRAQLLSGYRMVDFARKVVGVGSVGTRCWIVLMLGRDDNDPLFLQIKEAEASVLEPFVGPSEYPEHGQRVVEGQRLMQAASDIFLGWTRNEGFDGVERHYYVRQLWDGKLAPDLTRAKPGLLSVYGQMCGWTLARAHARSGDRVAIAAYLGSGPTFDRSIVEFALSYAEQNARDHQAVSAAVRDGRLAAS